MPIQACSHHCNDSHAMKGWLIPRMWAVERANMRSAQMMSMMRQAAEARAERHNGHHKTFHHEEKDDIISTYDANDEPSCTTHTHT
eukprot:1147044-Pelagomonas_calceolata.AAC.1